MGSVPIVIDSPRFDRTSCILDGRELSDIQTLIAQSSVEGFHLPVLSRFSRMDEVELHTASIRPFLERLGGELRGVINRDRDRRSGLLDRPIHASATSWPPNVNLGSSIGL